MNDREIDKLLDAVGSWRIPKEVARQRVRDWLFGQSEYFSELGGKLAIVIPEEWIDKELE